MRRWRVREWAWLALAVLVLAALAGPFVYFAAAQRP